MAKRIRLSALPAEVRNLPPAVRDELLREEGIEIDTVAEELAGNPFGSGMQPEQIANAKVAGEMLSRIPRAAAGTASAAAGGAPLPVAAASGFLNSLVGPEPTSGHGMANMASDVAFGRLAPIIQGAKALASPARAALTGGALGTANVAVTQAAGNKLAQMKGEQTEDVNPFIGGILGMAAGLAPAASRYMGKAKQAAQEVVDIGKAKQAALDLLKGGRLSPSDLADAQRRLTQGMQAQGAVEALTPTQRITAGLYDNLPASQNPFTPPPPKPTAAPAPRPAPKAVQPEPRVRIESATPAPRGEKIPTLADEIRERRMMGMNEEERAAFLASENPFRPASAPIPATTAPASQPTEMDDFLLSMIRDPAHTIENANAMFLDLRKRGLTPEQVGSVIRRYRELAEADTTATRAAATQATSLDFRRVDEGRPSRSKYQTQVPSPTPSPTLNLPSPTPSPTLPSRTAPVQPPAPTGPITSDGIELRPRTQSTAPTATSAPLAAPAGRTIGDLATTSIGKAFEGLDDEIRKVSPKALASLDDTVKQTLGEMRTKGGKGGIAPVITKALEDPAEFSNLPRYIDALDTAFPNLNARKAVQAQITESVLSGFGEDTAANLSMLQRIRGMGEDRAKVINKVFGSQDAYKNIETLSDIMEASQSPVGKPDSSWLRVFFNNGGNIVAGIPVGALTFYMSSAALGPAMATGALAGVAAAGTAKAFTVGVDKLAEYVAQNRGKSLDVIYDLVRGGGKYTPQTVNQVLGGLRRRAADERDATPEEMERLEFLRREGLR